MNDNFKPADQEFLESVNEIEGKYLTFFIDGQLSGVPIKDVVQIIGIQEITELPNSLPYVKGIINLRGDIIPLIDIRIRFGKEEAEYTDRTCVIVVNIKDRHLGYIVDEVDEVTDIASEFISPPPKLSDEATNRYLTGIARLNETITLLIDTEKVLSEDDFESLIQTTR